MIKIWSDGLSSAEQVSVRCGLQPLCAENAQLRHQRCGDDIYQVERPSNMYSSVVYDIRCSLWE
jgi:hypothetical protein